ncbi:hypothetical protein DFH08DRAFT_808759 [Mycena albidolilacea]|uniref:Uncharacterized protein n=1 Tax=Mycena albidolilacea TaxID=1033008 RepID=A0AAD7ERH9_9AGAR|nr:hypothetical protein DFH08DRAFT_808759 [Mycena albidolilacea]
MPTAEELAAYEAKLAAAMLANSPERPSVSHKRKHPGTNPENSEDKEDDDELPASSIFPSSDAPTSESSDPNGNMVAFAKRYAAHKCLKPSQVSEVEAFATNCSGVNSKLDGIVSAQPTFKVSPALEKNLRQLAHGVTILSKLSSYKGELAKKHLLLCACFALMRQQYKLFPGDDFWDKLDQRLAWIRKTAGYDENKISKAFKLALANDRADHSIAFDYTLPEDAVNDAWQALVDTSIDADGPDA